MTATNYAGESPCSTEGSCATLPPDWPAPTGLRYARTASGEITLSWDPVTSALCYSVRYALLGSTDYYLTPVHDTTYVRGGLPAEPRMHRRHADCYAYEFFVARRDR